MWKCPPSQRYNSTEALWPILLIAKVRKIYLLFVKISTSLARFIGSVWFRVKLAPCSRYTCVSVVPFCHISSLNLAKATKSSLLISNAAVSLAQVVGIEDATIQSNRGDLEISKWLRHKHLIFLGFVLHLQKGVVPWSQGPHSRGGVPSDIFESEIFAKGMFLGL